MRALLLPAGLALLMAGCGTRPRQENAFRPAEGHEDPADAARYFYAKRTPSFVARRGMEQFSIRRRTEAAIQKLDALPHYSTRSGQRFESRATLRRAKLLNQFRMLHFDAFSRNNITAAGDTSAFGVWEPLGPNDGVGGRTRSLIFDPRRPMVLYAGSVAGGVWQSEDAGESWHAIGDDADNLAVSSLAIDSRGILYAATGEGYFNSDALRGAGIFKREPGGGMWRRLPGTDEPNFYYTRKIAVSPSNPDRIYAATATGVLRSKDGGLHWTRPLTTPDQVFGCFDLAVQPVAPFHVLAACGTHPFYPEDAAQRAAGAIWRAVDADDEPRFEQVFTTAAMGRTSLALAPSNPAMVYAVVASKNDRGLAGVYRSKASGSPGSWEGRTLRGPGPLTPDTVLLTNPAMAFWRSCWPPTAENPDRTAVLHQGWYGNAVTVDPTNPEVIWVGGVDLFRSDDGGRSWGIASHWWLADRQSPFGVHADQHAILFDPGYGRTNQTLWVANDGGIWKTKNALGQTGRTFRRAPGDSVCGVADPGNPVKWESHNRGYSVAQFYHGSVFPDGASYIGGTQDNGVLAADPAWRTVLGGDGGYVVIDRNAPNNVYFTSGGPDFYRSWDGGRSVQRVSEGLEGQRMSSIAPLAIDPSRTETLWTGGTQMFRSTDQAARWVKASNVFDEASYEGTASGLVSAIAVAPSDSNVVLAGFREDGPITGGWIHRTTRALSAGERSRWERSRPREGWVSSIAIHPTNASIVYATYSSFDEGGDSPNRGHVFRSTDGGASWTVRDGSGQNRVPDLPVHCLAIDPLNPNRLYIGTDAGVLVSLDGGEDWEVENTGFANVVTEWLAIRPGSPAMLFAFTHGRGVWRVPIR